MPLLARPVLPPDPPPPPTTTTSENDAAAGEAEQPLDASELRPFDLAGTDLCSGRQATTGPLTGRAKRDLSRALDRASKQKDNALVVATMLDAYDEVALGCTELLDGKKPNRDAIRGLHPGEAKSLVIRVRFATWPADPIIRVSWYCAPQEVPKEICCDPERTRKIEQEFDLTALQYRPIEAPKPVPLPFSRRTATFDAPSGRSREEFRRQRRGGDEFDFAALLARRVMLDGKAATAADFEVMHGADLDALQQAMTVTGGPDTEFTATCPNCHAGFAGDVVMLRGFFSPRASRAS